MIGNQYRLLYAKISNSQKLKRIGFNKPKWYHLACNLIYTWLLPWGDDDGRIKAEPFQIKANIIPYINITIQDVENILCDLHKCELIYWYEVNHEYYIQILGWEENQKIRRDRYKGSEFPAFNQNATDCPSTDNQNPQKCDLSPLPSPSLSPVSLPSPLPIKKKKLYSRTSDEIRLSELLFSLIQERDPKRKNPNLQEWAKQIDFLIRIDKRTPKEIEQIIVLCQKDEFWRNNILSTKKLKIQFSQLSLKLKPKDTSGGIDEWANEQ